MVIQKKGDILRQVGTTTTRNITEEEKKKFREQGVEEKFLTKKRTPSKTPTETPTETKEKTPGETIRLGGTTTQPTQTQPKNQTFLQQVAEAEIQILSSPYTTVALASVLTGLVGYGAITGTLITSKAAAFPITSSANFIARMRAGQAPLAGDIATRAAINTKTMGLTTSFFVKSGLALSTTGLLVGAIGSYPFAGFIKEEALQTLSLGVRSAVMNEDLEGAEKALEEQEEILNPGLWDKIFGSVPYANVLAQLKGFYEAARTKVEIDRKVVNDMKIQAETGETDDEKWKRIRQEELDADKASVDYYNEQRKLMVDWERDADLADRDDDAKFWRDERAKQTELETKEREESGEFWLNYRKEAQKLNEGFNAGTPRSALNFGLLK